MCTRKIVSAAVRISKGSNEKLMLGDLSIERDWGWAPEYVIAMWMMLQHSDPEDFVIATGKYNRLQDFLEMVFDNVGMDWRSHVVIDKTLYRPSELKRTLGDPLNPKRLGWISRKQLPEIIQEMIAAEQEGVAV